MLEDDEDAPAEGVQESLRRESESTSMCREVLLRLSSRRREILVSRRGSSTAQRCVYFEAKNVQAFETT